MNERGAGTVEAILLVVVFFIPILWLLTSLAELHSGAMAATAAAREAGFDASRANSVDEALKAADAAVAAAFRNGGLDPTKAEFRLRGAVRPGARMEVEIGYPVRILRAPFADGAGPVVWVRAHHAARVDRFGSG